MNVADSEVVAAMMELAGYVPTDVDTEAAAVLLNTCSIRENAEQKIYSRLAYWNSFAPEAWTQHHHRRDRMHGGATEA